MTAEKRLIFVADPNAWRAAYESAERSDARSTLKKLLNFLRNPFSFFESDSSPHPDVIAFGSLLIRINAVVFFLMRSSAVLLHPEQVFPNIEVVLGVMIGLLAFVLLLSKYISGLLVFLFSRIYGFFVKFVTDRDNVLAAERVVVFSSSVLVLWFVPFGLVLSSVLFVALMFIGTTKQYGIDPVRALLAVLFPAIIIFVLLFVSGVVKIW